MHMHVRAYACIRQTRVMLAVRSAHGLEVLQVVQGALRLVDVVKQLSLLVCRHGNDGPVVYACVCVCMCVCAMSILTSVYVSG
jgi:hypothetical protein